MICLAALATWAAPVETPVPQPATPTYDPMRSFAQLVEAVQDSVVTIEVTTSQDLSGVPPQVLEMFGFDPDDLPPPVGEGSGFVIDPSGLVLTNHHVVAEAEELRVFLRDGTRIEATVVGGDAAMDIALLRLAGDRDWPSLQLGASADVRVGDWVLALGNTLGFGSTATVGIVSGKGRVLGHDMFGRESYIQTDAAINQGNSGGPLFDLNGRVIGMNTAIIAGANTVGFAIPSDLITEVLDDLRTLGRVSRGFLGVAPRTLSIELRRDLDVQVEKGAFVADVFADTPASRCGLRVGDVVIEVDGTPIESDKDLISAIASKRPGVPVQIEIERERERQVLKVVLTERAAPDITPSPQAGSSDGGVLEELGLELVVAPTSEVAAAGLKKGVLVARVRDESAAHGRLRAGDLIAEVNNRAVDSPTDVERVLSRSAGSAIFLVIRDDEQQFVVLMLP